ncbi:hypothetical protein GGTG_11231 [Gaeumannomyces tritici R3-111a-1]|uniref:Uncharacterized protein n=1 Tax=Gaeumannomyces tritici (strain R3-111a-1) TaxID=644352 RepID=J3PCL1_GAET3|nr:hypothetical protein GGTG_11231 [Gaeumannomyces tritici R3-111a-1]EJT71981.1 hypothetical protein GGTG_11231 [Gaeumannomyces tritici R3-111a-1]
MPTKWDEKAMACLCTAIMGVLSTESLSQKHKDKVVSLIKSGGYPDVTWNGIRWSTTTSRDTSIMPRFEDIKADLMEAFFYLNPPTKDQQVLIVDFLRKRALPTSLFSPLEAKMPKSGTFQQDWAAPGIHEDMLRALVARGVLTSDNVNALVEEMHTYGYRFTKRALK